MTTQRLHIGLAVFADIESGLDLANALANEGHKVTLYLSHKVVFSTFGGPEPLERRISELGMLPPHCEARIFHFPRLRDLRSYKVVEEIIRCMEIDQIDLAHIFAGPAEVWLAVLAFRLQKIPVVSTLIHPIPDVGEARPYLIDRVINKLVVYSSDMIIVNGLYLVDIVKNEYHLQDDRLTYIPLCPRYTVTKWSHQNQVEKPGTVLFFGRALPHKGLEYLIKAQPLITAIAPEVRFLVAVHGNDMKSYRQLIRNPNYFIIREGFIPGPEMAEIYEQSSLVVLPYLSAATSGVLMDAYMFGKPVVATCVGSLPEYVQDGITGYLVPPRDPTSLAQAIVRLIQDEQLRASMGQNAREWINKVGKTIAAQHNRVYQALIKSYTKRRKT